MLHNVILPKLGQQTVESTIVKWHKKVGDAVKKGDVLFEMETDKANLEAESFFEGTLLKILVPEGATVPVNTVVAYLGTPGEALPATPPPPPPPPVEPSAPAAAPALAPAAAPAPARQPAPAAAPVPAVTPAPAPAAPAAPARLVISPRARALAEARCISPARIAGTGPGGRIVEQDVAAYLKASRYDELRITPAARQLAARERVDVLTVRPTGAGNRIMVEDVQRALAARPRKLSRMRQVIARRLTESFASIPHFYVTVSVDMTGLLALRQEMKDRGTAYKVTDFILEAVVLSLVEFPALNSTTDGTSVRWRESVDLGLAVSLDEGLVVPVIRGADLLGMRELSEAAAVVAEKARSGKLLPDDMTGSTFTVSNMGMLDVEDFSAIINPGEAAILAVSSTRPCPAVHGGKVAVRSMMKLTLSADHRIVDGAMAARFVNAIKAKLEDMELWKRLS